MTASCKQHGIALIQVLLVVAITSVFALYLTQQAREQVKMAQWYQDRAQAEVALHSAESLLVFELLTSSQVIGQSSASPGSIQNSWNFHNQPFFLNDIVEVQMQDQAGLLSLHFLRLERFTEFMVRNGVSIQRAREIGAKIFDWQDKDAVPRPYGADRPSSSGTIRNGKLPAMSEIEKIIQLSARELELIYNNTTIYYAGDINPLTAPPELLSSIVNNDSAMEQILKVRAAGGLTERAFKDLLPVPQSGDLMYIRGNTMRINYFATINDITINRETVVNYLPYADGLTSPVNLVVDRN